MNKIQIAKDKFAEGYNCSQSVLFAYCNSLGIEESEALRIASGFGAGMGRKQEVCGAVTGGIMVIGAKYFSLIENKQNANNHVYSKTRELLDNFSAIHGTFLCHELLGGCDLMTEEGQNYFKLNDLKNKVCNKCVEDTVVLLKQILKS